MLLPLIAVTCPYIVVSFEVLALAELLELVLQPAAMTSANIKDKTNAHHFFFTFIALFLNYRFLI